MTAPEEIISDAEIIRVHAYANFGSMTPRQVVNDGVRKYAVGFTGGSTQVAILREHGLIKKPKGCGYKADLTEKGKRYARAIWSDADLHDATKTLGHTRSTNATADWNGTPPRRCSTIVGTQQKPRWPRLRKAGCDDR